MLYIMIATAEVPIPRAVLIRASEIPFASATASGAASGSSCSSAGADHVVQTAPR